MLDRDNVRKKRVSFILYVDSTQYSDPAEWNFNQIFGFRSVLTDGAMIQNVEVDDLGSLNEVKKRRQACQQQTTSS